MTAVANRDSRVRRWLAGLLLVTASTAVAPGLSTLAGFTSQDISTGNSIQAGTLDIRLDQQQAYIDVEDFAPGSSTSALVAVSNQGTLPGSYVLRFTDIRGDLAGYLTAEVRRDGEPIHTGELTSIPEIPSSLDVGQAETYSITISWPEGGSGDDAAQGSQLTWNVSLTAEQVS